MGPKSIKLRVIAISNCPSPNYRASQEPFPPQGYQAFPIEIRRMDAPEPQIHSLRNELTDTRFCCLVGQQESRGGRVRVLGETVVFRHLLIAQPQIPSGVVV